uniref:Betaine--homocysteine S-methyltransferase 1-like n=1 Tax=Stegastes partitus TaxID=144197 RepID=A0A3B4ZS28_9TELE
MAPAGAKKNILERLEAGEVVIGDGGFVFALEKRGYVKAGPWTPEAAAEHPEAVRQLHREFLRAGSNVMQTFTFYASDDKLENRGNAQAFTGQQINAAACDLAREVANEGDALVAGGVSQTPSYLSCKSENDVKTIFKKQVDVFVQKNVDFLIAEYFEHVEEAEWAVQVLKTTGKPVAATLCIGPEGDLNGVSPGDCAVRLVKAESGANSLVFSGFFSVFTVPDSDKWLVGFGVQRVLIHMLIWKMHNIIHKPVCPPTGLEPRILTRWDMQKYARDAYDAGVRYIGGCCGFEPYHIRALAEELQRERGFLPAGSEKHGTWGSGLEMHTKPWVRARARRDYWEKLKPASGRPYCPAMAVPDGWGVTKGHADLMQQKEATSKDQLKALFDKANQGH